MERKKVALLYGLLQVIINLNCFSFVFIVDSMALHNLEDWMFSLVYLSNDPIQLSQLSLSKWYV